MTASPFSCSGCFFLQIFFFLTCNYRERLYIKRRRKFYPFYKSGCSAVWFSAFDWGSKGREFESHHPDHFFCSLFSGPYRPDFFIPRFYPQNLKHLQQYHRPKREQTENGKISIFRCVLHRSSQNSLFGQVAGPFQEIISQPHREQHFTETHHKITENSLFFSILYFPT